MEPEGGCGGDSHGVRKTSSIFRVPEKKPSLANA